MYHLCNYWLSYQVLFLISDAEQKITFVKLYFGLRVFLPEDHKLQLQKLGTNEY